MRSHPLRRTPRCISPCHHRAVLRSRLLPAIAGVVLAASLGCQTSEAAFYRWYAANGELWNDFNWAIPIPGGLQTFWKPDFQDWSTELLLAGEGSVRAFTGAIPEQYMVKFRTADGLIWTRQNVPEARVSLLELQIGQEIRQTGGEVLAFSDTGARLRTSGGLHRIIDGAVRVGGASGGGALTLELGSTLQLDTTVTGSGRLIKQGTGTLVLLRDNSFSGGLELQVGTVQLQGGSQALGSGLTTLVGGTLQVQSSSDSRGLRFGNGSATATGSVLIDAGKQLRLLSGAGMSFEGAAGRTTTGALISGAVELANGLHTLTMRTVGAGPYDLLIDGAVSGAGGLELVQTDTASASSFAVLSQRNSYLGGTLITSGTLVTTVEGALPSARALRIGAGGTLLLAAPVATSRVVTTPADQTVGLFEGAGRVDLASAMLTVGADNGSSRFSGTVTGAGTLRKTGTGTLTLAPNGSNLAPGTLRVDNGTLVLDVGGEATFGGTLVGSAPVRKTGTGTLTLAGGGSLTGAGIEVASGTLRLTGGGLQSALLVTSQLVFDTATDTSFSGVISGPGTLQKVGSGHLRLTGNNTLGGKVQVLAGGLTLSSSGMGGAVEISDGSFLQFEMAGDGSFAGAISGTGTLVKSFAGTLQLKGDGSNFTGTTIVTGGRLVVGRNTQGGRITIANGTLEFREDTVGNYSPPITGGGDFVKSGAGLLTIGSGSVFSGTTTVQAGTLQVGVRALAGTTITHGNLRLMADAASFSGVVTGSGNLELVGPGRLLLTATQTYAGATRVLSGTLAVLRRGVLPENGVLQVDGTLELGNSGTPVGLSVASLQGAGTGLIQLWDTLTVGTGGASSQYDGRLAGSGTLRKQGTGTLTLGNAVTLDGGIVATGGTLVTASGNALQGLPLMLSGARLDIGGSTAGRLGALRLGDGATGGLVAEVVGTADSVLTLAGPMLFDAAPGLLSQSVALAPAFALSGNVEVSAPRRSSGPYDIVFQRGVRGSGRLIISSGIVGLADSSNHTGGTSVLAGGTLVIGVPGALVGGSALTLDGALRMNPTDAVLGMRAGANDLDLGALDGSGTVLMGSANLGIGLGGASSSFSGSIQGSGLLTKNGLGELIFAGSNGYTGGTLVREGTLRLASATALPDGGAVEIVRGTVVTGGFAQRWGALTGSRNASIQTGNGDLRVGSLNTSTLYMGRISGTGQFEKAGTGQLTLRQATVGAGSAAVRGGTLVLEDAQLSAPGGVTVDAGATLRLAGSVPEVVTQSLTHAGTVSGGGQLSGRLTTLSGGRLELATGEQLTVRDAGSRNDGVQQIGAGRLVYRGDLDNRGRVVLAGGLLKVDGGLHNNVTGRLEGQGQLDIGAAGLVNDGVLQFNAGASTMTGLLHVGAAGSVAVASGGIAEFAGPVVTNGIWRTDGGGLTRFQEAVSGAGSFSGAGRVEFLGTYRPGNSPALVEFDGDVVFSDVLELEVGGSVAGEDSDQLVFHGNATLGGTLRIVLINGFTPVAGQAITLFQGHTTGNFSRVELPTLPAGVQWDVQALADGRLTEVSAVPEPGEWALLLGGLGLIGLRKRQTARAA